MRWATDEQVADFFKWLSSRFGAWELPSVFFRAKIQTGCRVEDLCSLRSSNVRHGTITFTSDTTKGRKSRTIPVSDDLFVLLDWTKGKKFVWEHYPSGLRAALKAKGCPTHRLRSDFSPGRMREWVMTLFRGFNDAEAERAEREKRPERPKLTSHMLRKLAFTTAWRAGIDPRKAAVAIGCNVDTMLKHYVLMDEQATTDEVFGDLGAKLRLPPHTTSHTTTPPAAAPNQPSPGEPSGA